MFVVWMLLPAPPSLHYLLKKKEKKKPQRKRPTQSFNELWVLISLTGKVSDDWIRDLGFNPRLHQKLIGVLV